MESNVNVVPPAKKTKKKTVAAHVESGPPSRHTVALRRAPSSQAVVNPPVVKTLSERHKHGLDRCSTLTYWVYRVSLAAQRATTWGATVAFKAAPRGSQDGFNFLLQLNSTLIKGRFYRDHLEISTYEYATLFFFFFFK